VPHDEPAPRAVWALRPSVAREDVPGLCADFVASLADGCPTVVTWDVSAATEPDAVTIEALARLQLCALRVGRRIRIEGACRQLADLLSVTGLDGVLSAPE